MKFVLFLIACCYSTITDSEFWRSEALSHVKWVKPFENVYKGSLGNDQWFYDGQLNACYNCVDRWAKETPNKTAIIYEDSFNSTIKYSYAQVLENILEVSNVLKSYGLQSGDCVTVYLLMSPIAVFTILACARLGIIHNCVFGGFSSDSLNFRIKDSNSKLLITQDYVFHKNKQVNYLEKAYNATKLIDEKN